MIVGFLIHHTRIYYEERVSYSGGVSHYEVIDFLKGFSITTIVLFHLIHNGYLMFIPSFVRTASTLGGTGVHVFIFCSGFGLYLSWMKKPLRYGEFLKRRIIKVYIPYIVVIVISALLPYMYQESDRGMALLSHILLFKMFVPKYETSFGGHFWFISTIIQFYLIFIPLCKILKKWEKLL